MERTKSIPVRTGPGISTLGLLGVLFIGLKLTGHITWSWLWVLSPFWIPWAIIAGVLTIFLSALLAIATIDWAAAKLK